MQAFDTAFSQVIDPQKFLGSAATALSDVTKQGWLGVLGLQPGMFGGDAGKLSMQALPRLWQYLQQFLMGAIGPIMQNLQGLGLDMSTEEGRNIRGMGLNQLMQMLQMARTQAQRSPLTPEEERKWTLFHQQIENAGNENWRVFVKALTPMAPQFEALSKAATTVVASFVSGPGFAELVRSATEGLQGLSRYLASDDFKQDILSFEASVKSLAKSTHDLATGIPEGVSAWEKLQQSAHDAGASMSWLGDIIKKAFWWLVGEHTGVGAMGDALVDTWRAWSGVGSRSKDVWPWGSPGAIPDIPLSVPPPGTFHGQQRPGPLGYIPEVAGTQDALNLIERYESAGRNVLNYKNSLDPNYYTAGGYWQIVNSTWNRYAGLIPGASQFGRAIDAPEPIQRQVAGQILMHEGYGPWSNYDRPLAMAIERLSQHIDRIASSVNVQRPAPVHVQIHGLTGGQAAPVANQTAGGVA
jgi:hypothetical protein